MIKLIDLIKLAGVELGDFKIHCATGSNPTPLETFFDGSFKEWQEDQNQKNFQCKQVISLIHLRQDRWLFAGVYAVKGFAPKKREDGRRCYLYDTEEVAGLAHLTGRAIVRFSKTFRASYLRGDKYADNLVVEAIPEKRMTIGDFPISTDSGKQHIKGIATEDVKKVAQIISDLISRTREPAGIATRDSRSDVVSQLERLAALKQNAMLSDEEFAEQKAKLLSK